MCGIAGIVRRNGEAVRTDDLVRMKESLRHRGPDDEGLFQKDHVGFAHTRLSILDLDPRAAQPMWNDDGSLVLVFNGEIYNYIELRQELAARGYRFRTTGDTEVLLKAYQEWGADCLPRCNGMFAFAVYDVRRDELFLARDRFGVKPLYLLERPGLFAFASEIKPLLPLAGTVSPNDQIVFDFLFHNVADHTEDTFFAGVRRLLPGHYLLVKGDRREARRWWTLEPKAASAGFREAFIDAIRLRLRSDVPVGVCLSGGLDSSAILFVMADLLKGERHAVRSFSVVYPGSPGDESRYVDQVVSALGIENRRVTPSERTFLDELDRLIEVQEEPFYSASNYNSLKVMELARGAGMKVLLNGQGADEALGGYYHWITHCLADHLRRGHLVRFLRSASAFSRRREGAGAYALRAFYEILPVPLRDGLRRWKVAPALRPDFYARHRHASPFHAAYSYADPEESLIKQMDYVLPVILRSEDKNSMAHSIEIRLPFLDYRLVQESFAIPFERKVVDGLTKWPLREAMAGTLPDSIRLRADKIGFTAPLEDWLRTPAARAYFEGIIRSRSFRDQPYWDAEKVQEQFRHFLAHPGPRADHIWRVLVMELWLRRFVDGPQV